MTTPTPSGVSDANRAVVDLFTVSYESEPDGVWSSPGRVNLIGEHTDYNRGLVLPFAIDARATMAVALADDGIVSVVSAQQSSTVHSAWVGELSPTAPTAQGWSAYLFGVAWVMAHRGTVVPGLRIALDSTVPPGAGLSSSAALECAIALAISDLMGLRLPLEEIARIAQRAENDFVGVPCGLMDQMASAACTEGHLLFFDTRADSIEQVPFDPAADGLAVLIVDTRVKHSLTDGEYAKRRAACEQAAGELGVSSLRELTVDDLPRMEQALSSELLYRRARHVVTENARVVNTIALLAQGKLSEIAPEMVASHLSLRDDYEVSDPALDLAVDTLLASGALGARMTGGGFGGSAIALVPSSSVDTIGAAVLDAFKSDNRTTPRTRVVTPSRGASRD